MDIDESGPRGALGQHARQSRPARLPAAVRVATCFNPGGRTSAMSNVLNRYIPLAIAVLMLTFAEHTFAQDKAKIKDIWDKGDIVAKLLISFVAAAVPSLIAWQIHRYNKRQGADDAAR